MQDFRLYLILDKELCGNRDLLKLAEEAISGGVDIIQLRDKKSPVRKLVETAGRLRELTQKRNITFIINDRIDVALAVNVDGVHLGEGDLPLNQARQILGKSKVIGVSAHSLIQAQEAEKMGADYIGAGAVFPTQTKSDAPVAGLRLIGELAANIRIPFVAIGGINQNNIEKVIKAGAKRVAVGEAILGREDVATAAREIKLKLSVN